MRCLITTLAIGFAAMTVAAPLPEATGPQPFLVARMQPVDKLFDDAKFLLKKFGKNEVADKFEARVLHSLGADSMAQTGIDSKKPTGCYVFFKQELSDSTYVLMLPVANEESILKFVGKFQVRAEKLEDGLYSLAMPDMTLPMFVRFANGYAYVTAIDKANVASDAIVSPARVFAGDETAMLAVTIRPEQIPEAVRKTTLEHIVEQLKTAGEDFYGFGQSLADAEMKVAERWLEAFVDGGKELTLRTTFERGSGELAFDIGMSARPKTKLATEMAAVKPGTSLFTKMLGDRGAINLSMNSRADGLYAKEIARLLNDQGASSLVELLEVDDSDEKAKAEVVALCKTLTPTVESGEFDFAFSLRPSGDRYCILLGTHVKEGKKIEDAIRKLAAILPDDKKKKLTLDAQTVGDFKLHKIAYGDENAMSQKLLGPAVYWFGVRDNAFVIGTGEGADKAVGETLAQVDSKPAPNMQFDVSVKKLKLFCDETFNIYSKVQEVFGHESDRVRIALADMSGGEQLKVRYIISLQMLVGLGLAFGDVDDFLPAVPVVPAMPAQPAK